MKVKLLSRIQLFVTLWTAACQASPFIESSRQGYWSGEPCPSPGEVPKPGIEPGSPVLQADSLPSKPPGMPFQKLKVGESREINILMGLMKSKNRWNERHWAGRLVTERTYELVKYRYRSFWWKEEFFLISVPTPILQFTSSRTSSWLLHTSDASSPLHH